MTQQVSFTLTLEETELLLDTLSHGASDIERDRYENLRDGYKDHAQELTVKLGEVNELERKIYQIIRQHKA